MRQAYWISVALLAAVAISALLRPVSAQYCPDFPQIQIGALMLDPVVENATGTYNGQYLVESTAQINGLKFWWKVANKNCQNVTGAGVVIGGVRHMFNLTIVNIGVTVGNGQRNKDLTKWALGNHTDINFWVGPYGSGTTVNVAGEVAKNQSKIMITSGATSSSIFICPSSSNATCEPGARRFQNTWGPISIAERYYVPAINLYKNKGAKTIALIYETSTFGTAIYQGSKAEALNNKYNITLQMSVPADPNKDNITKAVDAIIAANPDVLVCGWYYASSVEMIRQFNARGYVPKGMATRIGDINLKNDLGKNASYLIDSNYWDNRLRGDDFLDSLYFPSTNASDTPAPQKWYNLYQETMGSAPGLNYEGVAFIAAQIFHRAIERAKSQDPAAVKAALAQLQFTSFWGKITFNALGYNELYPFAQTQYDENSDPQIVYPLIASTVELIYPIPTWEERYTKLYAYWQPAEQAVVGLAGIFMAISFIMIVVVAALSNKHRVIKAASPPFLILFLCGSLLLYTGVIMWSLYVPTAVCNAVAWCLSVGFVVMFGSLFGRTFRILQIITKSKYQPVKFTNMRLLIFVGILVLIDIVVLIIWTAAFPIQGTLIQPDKYRPLQDVLQCQFKGSDFAFVGILGAYKIIIMIAGLFFSVKIWNFKMSEFNESKPIAFGMYNLVFFLVLAIVAVSVFDGITQRVASYVLRSVAIMLATLITVLVIMIPKLYAVYKIPMGDSSRPSATRNMSSTLMNPGTNRASSILQSVGSSISESELETRLAKLQKEFDIIKKANKKLKEDNAALKKELTDLKKTLAPSGKPEPDSASSEISSTEEGDKKKSPAAKKASVDTEDSDSEESSSEEVKKPAPAAAAAAAAKKDASSSEESSSSSEEKKPAPAKKEAEKSSSSDDESSSSEEKEAKKKLTDAKPTEEKAKSPKKSPSSGKKAGSKKSPATKKKSPKSE